MSETIVQQPTTPQVRQPAHPASPSVSTVSQDIAPKAPVQTEVKGTPKTEDILKRMAEQKAPEVAKAPDQEVTVSLEDIKDPVVRQLLEEKRLNLEKYYNKKYMENADGS